MTYTVAADVDGRDISWTFDNARQAMPFWRKMAETMQTPDTDDVVFSAMLIRDGKPISRFDR